MIRIGDLYAADDTDLNRVHERLLKLETRLREDDGLEHECGTLNDRVAALEVGYKAAQEAFRTLNGKEIGLRERVTMLEAVHVDCLKSTVEAEPVRDLQGGIRISAKLYDSLIADRRRLEWLMNRRAGGPYGTRAHIDSVMRQEGK